MKTIYLTRNGIAMQVLNIDEFKSFNWFNFSKGDSVFIYGEYFADFVSYEKSSIHQDEIIKLELN